MSLQAVVRDGIPVETVRVAHAAFPNGCRAMRIRDLLGAVFTDLEFADLFSSRGRPGLPPALLALVSVLQFTEGLTDRQAADAVRGRIDWKYALGLPLEDHGFDFSVLSEFRARLIDGGRERRVLDAILDAARRAGLLKPGGRARTDSTHVLAAAKDLNQAEFVHETMRAALNALAVAAPHWLRAIAPEAWYVRYAKRFEDTRSPSRWSAGIVPDEQIGADGLVLLRAVTAPHAPAQVRALPAVEILRRAWVQQYTTCTDEDGRESTRRRTKNERAPASLRIASPYDPEARTGSKNEIAWDGYKVHLTETCEPDAPHLITSVITTPAPVPDVRVTAAIHDQLATRGLLPDEHLVDSGYMDAGHINDARRDHHIDLIGPIAAATTWQNTRTGALDASQFTIDWHAREVTCPAAHTSVVWRETTSHRGTPVTRIRFAARHCQPCPLRDRCTTSPHGRQMTLRPREEHETLAHARTVQTDTSWRRRYQHRSGIEGTIAQAVGAFGARRSRYHGHAKTSLQHILTAAGINLTRIDAWITEQPLAPTRVSRFAALRPAS